MAMGLPVVSILGLFGGIPVDYVAVAYVGSISSAVFVIALTVLVSTLARRVRQAVLTAYLLMLAWLFLPSLIALCGMLFTGPTLTGSTHSGLLRQLYSWVAPVNTLLVVSSPAGCWLIIEAVPTRRAIGIGLPGLMSEFEWMVALQLGGAAVLLLLAVWRLRPIFRRQEETPARRTWFRPREGRPRRLRWHARPECGEDAVLWKERYFAPADIFTRMVLLPAIVVATVPLGILTETEGGISHVFLNLWRYGFAANQRQGSDSFAWALRIDLGWYTAFWLLAVAGAAASSVTIEREEDTWISLTSTLLTGWEILRAKVLGAIWNQRGFGAVLIALWLLGLVSGSVHPLRILASVAVVGVLTWFVAALGIHASLRAPSTSKALVATLVTLCLFNAYPLIILDAFRGNLSVDSSFALLGALPRLAASPLVTYHDSPGTWNSTRTEQIGPFPPTHDVAAGWGFLAIIIGAAAFLTWRVLGRFDRWLDRPRLSSMTERVPIPIPARLNVTTREP
jgi:hypothetical protein